MFGKKSCEFGVSGTSGAEFLSAPVLAHARTDSEDWIFGKQQKILLSNRLAIGKAFLRVALGEFSSRELFQGRNDYNPSDECHDARQKNHLCHCARVSGEKAQSNQNTNTRSEEHTSE